jgi:hypothetical protein
VTGFSVGNLKVETADGKSFTLLEPFLFVRPNGEVIPVPAGAKSDGASTPSALWITLPPFGAYWRAAFLHDHLYRETMLPKEECDDIFKEAMESLGVRWDDLNTLYEGVHLFGWSSFKEDRDQVKKELTA